MLRRCERMEPFLQVRVDARRSTWRQWHVIDVRGVRQSHFAAPIMRAIRIYPAPSSSSCTSCLCEFAGCVRLSDYAFLHNCSKSVYSARRDHGNRSVQSIQPRLIRQSEANATCFQDVYGFWYHGQPRCSLSWLREPAYC